MTLDVRPGSTAHKILEFDHDCTFTHAAISRRWNQWERTAPTSISHLGWSPATTRTSRVSSDGEFFSSAGVLALTCLSSHIHHSQYMCTALLVDVRLIYHLITNHLHVMAPYLQLAIFLMLQSIGWRWQLSKDSIVANQSSSGEIPSGTLLPAIRFYWTS